MYLGEALDEIDGDVRPDLRRDVERLKEARRVQGLRLVALTNGAREDVVADKTLVAVDDEVRAESM